MKTASKVAMKAKKAMKKKRVSKVATGKKCKVLVLRGSKEKTRRGLTAENLTKTKDGRVVSKKRSAQGKCNPWMPSTMEDSVHSSTSRYFGDVWPLMSHDDTENTCAWRNH